MTNKIIIINGPNLNLLGEREQSQYGSSNYEELKKNCFDQAKKQSAKGNPWMAKVAGSYWGFYDRWKKYGTYRHN